MQLPGSDAEHGFHVRQGNASDNHGAVREDRTVQGIIFAVQAAAAGFGALDWLFFHGHNTAVILRFLGI